MHVNFSFWLQHNAAGVWLVLKIPEHTQSVGHSVDARQSVYVVWKTHRRHMVRGQLNMTWIDDVVNRRHVRARHIAHCMHRRQSESVEVSTA